ncbi:MAG: fibronectin type III domain-containing protein, partial [Lachnospiraceae bacterium]|nr:fibronectin type III domain-containing protein [Lachnospiraceae bacterium]
MNEKMQYTKFKHLIVMVLTLFVAFGIVVGSKTFDVNAAEDIVEATLHFGARPVAGNTYDTEEYKNVCSVVTKEGDPEVCEVYQLTEVNTVRWYHGKSTNDSDMIKDGEKFNLNEEYTALVYLKAKSGYTWKRNGNTVTSTINVYGGTVYKATYTFSEQIAVCISFKALEGLKRLDIYVTEPVVGQNPNTSYTVVTEPANAFIDGKNPVDMAFQTIANDPTEELWEVSSTNSAADWDPMSMFDVFEQGKYYRIHRMFIATPGLAVAMAFEEHVKPEYSGLAEGFSIYVNGVKTSELDKVGKWSLANPISKVECKVKVPVEGNKPNYSPSFTGDEASHLQYTDFISGKEVMFKKIGWYKRNESNKWVLMSKDETFEAGKEYEVALAVKGSWEYYLSADTKYYVNGEEADHYKTITYVFTALPTVKELYFTIPEPVEGESLGEVKIEADVKNAILPSTIDSLNKSGSRGYQVSENGKDYTDMKPTDKFEAGKYYRNNVVGAWFVAGLLVELLGKSMYDEKYAAGSILNASYYINGKEAAAVTSDFMVDFGKLEPKPTPTPEPTPTPTPAGPAVSPDGITAEGTELAALEEVVVATENDKDLVGSSYNKLQAKVSKATKKSLTLKWNAVEGAEGYVIYGNKCAKGNKYEKITELPAETLKFTHKKLKKGTYYKYLVVAYKTVDGKKVVITTSKTIHA